MESCEITTTTGLNDSDEIVVMVTDEAGATEGAAFAKVTAFFDSLL